MTRFASVLLYFAALTVAASSVKCAAAGFEVVDYNNPKLVVDLGVGLWARPLPMDFDGDGDNDLLVATTNTPSNGIFFFENPGGDAKSPVFKPAVRLGAAKGNLQISYVGDSFVVTTPGLRYPDFKTKFLTGGQQIPYKRTFYAGRSKQWKLCDYDGDGVVDLIIGASDWREYGWDDAYNSDGVWTRGPLHAHIYFVKNLGTNAAPKYGKAAQIQAGHEPLDVFGLPSPNLADWDNDGDLDIICGEFLDKLTYFENIGTRQSPRYAKGRLLMHEGKTITMDLQMILPVAFDWDKDGDVDLVVGQEDGRVALMENTGKTIYGMPAFLPPSFFRQRADHVKVGALVTPCSCDWDGDGDEDLICGDTAGYISFVEDLDGGDPPKWAAPRYLEADGRVIRIQAGYNGSIQGPAEAKWGYTVPYVADWNHDGLLDIVVNSIWGEVLWYENVGAPKEPRLKHPQPVEVEWSEKPPKPAWTWWNPKGKELATQWRTSPVVFDLNRDGLNDLVMLDHEGYLAFFERRRFDGALQLLPGKRVFLGEDGKPLRLNAGKAGRSGRRKLALVDWDRDGRLDILINSRSIDFLRNVAADGGYIFRSLGKIDAQVLAGHTTCPTIVDWGRDGVPDLLVGAEDGFLYYFKNPNRIARKRRGAPQAHLVAAWDFEEGKGGPFADKATAGSHSDDLVPLGDAKALAGIGIVPAQAGCAFRAASSADLELGDELTIWLRLRVKSNPTGFISLVDKRRFRDPEERSYGLFITPGAATPNVFAVGGQVSEDGTAAKAVGAFPKKETIAVGEWREVTMIVERGGGGDLALCWYASTKESPESSGDVQLVAGPAIGAGIRSIFRSARDLFVGNCCDVTRNSSSIELDEARIYNCALSLHELAAIVPGELSKGER